MIALPENYRFLVVDDEPDIHTVTRLSLRTLRYRGRRIEIAQALTGREAVEAMRAHPDTAVILLDVVMETSLAGLEACRAIRQELGNRFVRILLCTGQPGVAPEKKVIEEYDIDGYLAKAELTSTRLYAAVRTAIKAFEELIELERHRQMLHFIHDSAVSLRAFEPLEVTLQRILTAAVAVAPAPLAVLTLETFDWQGNPRRCMLHISTESDQERAEAVAAELAARVAADATGRTLQTAGTFGDGFLVPIVVHRDLGYGWMYLACATPDDLAVQALLLLASHASNALYSTVAQAILASREGPFYDSLIV
jgi:CheY-like chemotaxis protein